MEQWDRLCMRVVLFYSISGFLNAATTTKKERDESQSCSLWLALLGRTVRFSSIRGLLKCVDCQWDFKCEVYWAILILRFRCFRVHTIKKQWFGGGRGHNHKVEHFRKGVQLESLLGISTLWLWPRRSLNHWYLVYERENAAIVKLKWPHKPRLWSPMNKLT